MASKKGGTKTAKKAPRKKIAKKGAPAKKKVATKKKVAAKKKTSARRAVRKPQRKALLMGINRYLVPGADLRGCVNNVASIDSTLRANYAFKRGDVTKLVDKKATTVAMKAAIKDLVKGARAGDVLFLHYSGHGSNVPDQNGDEADHRDEILCPTDLDWSNPLHDDWLRSTFSRLSKSVNLTVIFDCCHSGSATRGFHPPDAPVISRYLACPLDMMATDSGRALRGTARGIRRNLIGSQPTDVTEVDTPEVLISGCRDNQESADARIGGTYNGALSYYLVETMKAAAGGISYRELHQGTLKRLKRRYPQVPQLSGRADNLDREFLAPYTS